MASRFSETLTPLQGRGGAFGLFALALFVRGAVLWSAIGHIGLDQFLSATPDTKAYLSAARALVDHSGSYETAFFTFGPGFPVYLAGFLRLFGDSPLPILIAQILLSSLSCVLIYRLGRLILDDYAMSMLAGVIAAFSLTSISLSCFILSDTLYLFLFLLSLVLFIEGMRQGTWWRFVVSGLLLGAAILTRTIGQFWPILLALIGLLLLRKYSADRTVSAQIRKRQIRQIALCVLIPLGVMIAWVTRNYVVNSVPALAMTAAGGPANVAAMTREAQTGVPYRQIEDSWFAEKLSSERKNSFTTAEEYRLLREKTLEVLKDSPGQMFSVYQDVVWENLTAREELHRDILAPAVLPWANYLNSPNRPFILAMIGLLALVVLRRFRPAAIFGLIYLYYTSMIGFTKWQGSRLFYPGLVAEAVLAAVAIVVAVRALVGLAKTVEQRWEIGRRVADWFDQPVASHGKYALVTAVGMGGVLVWLFWDFIFSNQMLKSVDVLGVGLAHHRLMWEHFAHTHRLVGWNPYDCGGIPVIESVSGAIFYPPALLDYLGYIPRMIGFNFLLHFLAGGFFMYLAARQLKLSPPAALIAGVAYGCSPLILSWVAPGHDGKIYSATLFPLIVLFVDRLMNDARLRDAVGLGIVFALMIVTPHLQMAFYSAAFVAGYALWKCIARLSSTRSLSGVPIRAALTVVGLVIGIGLSAIQWLPSAHYIPNESPRAYEQTGLDYASTYSLHQEELVSLVVPEFCGLDETDGPKTYWGRNSFKDNSESFGAAAALLALIGLVLPGHRRKYWWLVVAGLVILYAIGAHTPLFGFLIAQVPLMGQMRAPSTAMFVALFAVAVLAGIGVDNIRSAVGENSRWVKRVNAVLLVAIVIVFMINILMIVKGRGFLGYYADYVYPKLADESPGAVHLKEAALENLFLLQQGLWRFWFVLVGIYLLIRFFARTQWSLALSLGLTALVVLSSSGIVSRCIKLIDPAVYWEPKPVTNYLREHAGINRAVGFALNQTSLLIGAYPVQSTIGFHSRPVMWYYRLSGEEPVRNLLKARFANLAGTRFIVFPNRPENILNIDTLGPIPLDTAAIFDDCVVFENKNAFPRAFMVDTFRVMDSLWPLMIETVNGTTDLRKVALLERRPDITIKRSGDSAGTARVDSYSEDSIAVSVTCRSNQLLILTDTYYPAWHAYIDGRPAQILRVDGAFRAVAVPAGNHRVEFVFASPYVRAGGAISLATLLGIPVGAWLIRRRRSRVRKIEGVPPPAE
ncbi:MAG: YfhO family protein [candidate division Zixibacteria bacterium]|nr:YfhO family protein [candidate division Zixibacteria bacterium]